MISNETKTVAKLLSSCVTGSPFVERWTKALDNEDWSTLAKLKCDPCDYTDPERYWQDNLLASLLRKNSDLEAKTAEALKAEAIENFFKSEHQCFQTNRRMYRLKHNFSQSKLDVAAWAIVARARKIISTIVGRRPRADSRAFSDIAGEIPAYAARAAFGPGATLSDPSLRCTTPDKLESVPTMTIEAMPLLIDWLSTKWADAHAERCAVNPRRALRLVRGGKFFTVKKTALVLRGCENQPSVNVYYQLGLGKELRKLFRPYVDLDLSKQRHGILAKHASIFGSHATIDLERASDTLATGVVDLLWPYEWTRHFNMLRTRLAILPDGREVRLEKISSMGNGFTFELESITFYALARAAAGFDTPESPSKDRGFSVLGDDIICPTKHAQEVISVLQYFGFSINKEKSFITGPFRESCGHDYFRGVPVRGYFREESIENPSDIIASLNGLRRTALAGGDVDSRWRIVKKAWHYLLGRLPRELRDLRGPESLGDIVIHSPEDEWKPRIANSIRYFRAYKPDSFTELNLEQHWNESVVFASKLYGVSSEDPQGRGPTMIRPRGDPLSYRKAWVSCS